MAGPASAQDVAAKDDAHLQSLGIKPELRRSLGFMSNFAVAFSYISVSTGTFTLIAVGLAAWRRIPTSPTRTAGLGRFLRSRHVTRQPAGAEPGRPGPVESVRGSTSP